MKEKRATLEVIAPSVDEAIEKGLADLGLPREAVEVEVLDQGSRGLFHIGSRQARVRLAVKPSSMEESGASQAGVPQMPSSTPPGPIKTSTAESSESKMEAGVLPDKPLIEAPAISKEVTVAPEPGEEESYELSVARDTVMELLEKMKVVARVSTRFGEADDKDRRVPIHVDVNGDDLSILIGRRAETLNALQYIASLIVSKELGHSVPLIIDVEGYRSRRENQIRQLARRMAEQAVKTNRRQVLEPMPANERRIVHIELRNHPDVKTESIGEEPRRKVTIIPKE
jgi:spoIIIJ-associated protein